MVYAGVEFRLAYRFNPLPLPKQGEMSISHRAVRFGIVDQCFNPLPLPKQGEIGNVGTTWPDSGILEFQSAPLAEARGDSQGTGARPILDQLVSIRSPCRSKGRC